MVEVKGWNRHATACNTALVDGMEIAPGIHRIVAPLGERYFADFGDDAFISTDVAGFGSAGMMVADFGPDGTNPSEIGLLLVTNASRGDGTRGGSPASHESLKLLINSEE